MIAYLSGVLQELTEDGVVLNVGGVGYDVLLPATIHRQMEAKAIGEPLSLQILTVLSLPMGGKASITLIGFLDRDEKAFFEEMLSVSGIGVKAAARALARPFAEVAAAVASGDLGFLKSLPGIGPKKATEIINQLAPAAARLTRHPETVLVRAGGVWSEARDVLSQLGYKSTEAEEMLMRARARLGEEAVLEAILAEVWKGVV